MAALHRIRYDFESGTLGAALTAGGTTITFDTAPSFATLGTDEYIVLSIIDPVDEIDSEIVYLTAYTSGATTGTISRGEEGTTGSAHLIDALWEHSPTVEDFRPPKAPLGFINNSDFLPYPGFVVVGADGSDSYAAGTLYYMPVRIEREVLLTAMAVDVSGSNIGSAGSLLRMGIYAADDDWQPTDLVLDAGTVAIDTAGRKQITGLSTRLSPGIYLKVMNNNSVGGVDFDALQGGIAMATGTNFSGQQNAIRHYVTSAFAAFAASGVAWDTDDNASGQGHRHPVGLAWTEV